MSVSPLQDPARAGRRLANETLAHIGEGEAELPLVCECGRPVCRTVVTVPTGVFARLRVVAGHYVVSAGCHDGRLEHAVEDGGVALFVVAPRASA